MQGHSNTRRFAAWVPTITGQLSFSLLGKGVAKALVANSAATPAIGDAAGPRHVVLAQERRTKDEPWPFWLKPSTRGEYILIGQTRDAKRLSHGKDRDPDAPAVLETDHVGVLEGRILVVPYHKDAAKFARRAIRDIRRHITRAVEAQERGDASRLEALRTDIEAVLARASDFKVRAVGADFSLYRTGEFRLTVDEQLPAKGTAADTEEFRQLIARQMYYFVKDAGHRHYHHQTSSDNLLPLIAADDDDLSWRRETLWSLTRAVLELRRGNQLAGFKHALGILAYADAFQSHLARVTRRAGEDTFDRFDAAPKYDYGHTRLSLEATIEEQSYLKSFWWQIIGILVATVLAAIAIWIAAVDIREAACEGLPAGKCGTPAPPVFMRDLLRLVIEQPIIVFGSLFALVVMSLELARRSIVVIRPVGFYLEWLSDWMIALGATVSRAARPIDPYRSDTFGKAVSVVATLYVSYDIIATVGAVFQLWPRAPFSLLTWALGGAFNLAKTIFPF